MSYYITSSRDLSSCIMSLRRRRLQGVEDGRLVQQRQVAEVLAGNYLSPPFSIPFSLFPHPFLRDCMTSHGLAPGVAKPKQKQTSHSPIFSASTSISSAVSSSFSVCLDAAQTHACAHKRKINEIITIIILVVIIMIMIMILMITNGLIVAIAILSASAPAALNDRAPSRVFRASLPQYIYIYIYIYK